MNELVAWARWKVAYMRWFFHRPFRWGDPSLGHGEQRVRNIKMILARHRAKEPKTMQGRDG